MRNSLFRLLALSLTLCITTYVLPSQAAQLEQIENQALQQSEEPEKKKEEGEEEPDC